MQEEKFFSDELSDIFKVTYLNSIIFDAYFFKVSIYFLKFNKTELKKTSSNFDMINFYKF